HGRQPVFAGASLPAARSPRRTQPVEASSPRRRSARCSPAHADRQAGMNDVIAVGGLAGAQEPLSTRLLIAIADSAPA
ncbi:MAG: hypothetical protein WB919_21010, partial [Candidatus Sulfotelmatobacter sp.]